MTSEKCLWLWWSGDGSGYGDKSHGDGDCSDIYSSSGGGVVAVVEWYGGDSNKWLMCGGLW